MTTQAVRSHCKGGGGGARGGDPCGRPRPLRPGAWQAVRSHCRGGGGVARGGDPCGRPRPPRSAGDPCGRPRPLPPAGAAGRGAETLAVALVLPAPLAGKRAVVIVGAGAAGRGVETLAVALVLPLRRLVYPAYLHPCISMLASLSTHAQRSCPAPALPPGRNRPGSG
jgi:hypothetical protein